MFRLILVESRNHAMVRVHTNDVCIRSLTRFKDAKLVRSSGHVEFTSHFIIDMLAVVSCLVTILADAQTKLIFVNKTRPFMRLCQLAKRVCKDQAANGIS